MLLLFRPLTLVTPFIFRTVLKLAIGYNHAVPVVTLFTVLFTLSKALISTLGILPGLALLNKIRTFILSPEAIVTLNTGLTTILGATTLTKTQIKSILKSVTPLLTNCLEFPKQMARGFTVLKYFILLSTLSPLLRLLLRTSIGFILSSIGIVWNDGIVNNVALKGLAEYILTSFEYLTGFTIPRFQEIDDVVAEEVVTKNSYFLSYLGIAILGIVGTCVGIGIIEYYIPNTFQNVPVVGDVIDFVKDIKDIWINVVTDNNHGYPRHQANMDDNLPTHPNTPEPTPGQELFNNTNFVPLSRTSSTDTIRALDKSVLDTPRQRVWEMTQPGVMIPADETIFNHNPVNPDILPAQHLLGLRLAARNEWILDTILNGLNNF